MTRDSAVTVVTVIRDEIVAESGAGGQEVSDINALLDRVRSGACRVFCFRE